MKSKILFFSLFLIGVISTYADNLYDYTLKFEGVIYPITPNESTQWFLPTQDRTDWGCTLNANVLKFRITNITDTNFTIEIAKKDGTAFTSAQQLLYAWDTEFLCATAFARTDIAKNESIKSFNINHTWVMNGTYNPLIMCTVFQGTKYVGSNLVGDLYFQRKLKIVPVESIAVVPSSLDLEIGQTSNLQVTILPQNATDKSIFWSSDDESVATVNQTGLMTAISGGSAVIYASSNGKNGRCDVNVLYTVLTDVLPDNMHIYSENRTVVVEGAKDMYICLVDICGRILNRSYSRTDRTRIPISNEGVYIVQILKDKSIAHKKVIVN